MAYWQSLPDVQYTGENVEKSDLEGLLEEYRKDGREHMRKLLKCQQEFDNLHIDRKRMSLQYKTKSNAARTPHGR